MARDSFFGERILWSARPVQRGIPLRERLAGLACFVLVLVALGFAAVISRGLGQPPTSLLLFAGWMGTLGLAVMHGPSIWRAGLQYQITEHQVIVRRGPWRRTIERNSLSYARINWHRSEANLGDLVLVRAVPTGALRRTLSITLTDIEAPDRVWALLREVEPIESMGSFAVPLPQRLDHDERVLWSGGPMSARWDFRRFGTAALALLLLGLVVRGVSRLVPPVLAVHAALSGGLFVLFVACLALAWLLVLAVAVGLAYVGLVRPARRLHETRYFVTNRRVLIRRGREELSLDRSRIAYVIAELHRSSKDVFLVLDGPRSRAMAVHGAFGEREPGEQLSPVLAALPQGEGPEGLLSASLQRAA